MPLRIDALPLETVPLVSIDQTDETFLLRRDRRVAPGLADSVATGGIFTPPVLSRRDDSLCRIVSGFSRLEAWRRLGRDEVAARVAGPDVSPEELLLLSIRENVQGTGLNIIEQAVAVEKIANYMQRPRVAAEVLPILGRKPAESVLDRLLSCLRLPEPVQAALAGGDLSEGLIPALQGFNSAAQIALTHCVCALRMTRSASRNFLREVGEVRRRDEISPEDLLAELGFDGLPDPEGPGVPRDRGRLLDALHARRFPILTRLEDDYAATHAALDLGDGARLKHPRDFEGDRYTLEVAAQSADDLVRAVERLAERLKNRRDLLDKLLDVRWEE